MGQQMLCRPCRKKPGSLLRCESSSTKGNTHSYDSNIVTARLIHITQKSWKKILNSTEPELLHSNLGKYCQELQVVCFGCLRTVRWHLQFEAVNIKFRICVYCNSP